MTIDVEDYHNIFPPKKHDNIENDENVSDVTIMNSNLKMKKRLSRTNLFRVSHCMVILLLDTMRTVNLQGLKL